MNTVRVEVVDVPTSYLDVKSGKSTTKKILTGARQTLAPVMDKNGRVITGVTEKEYDKIIKDDDNISEPLKYREFYKNFSFKIGNDGKELDMKIPRHRLIYAFLKSHPEVANSKKELNTAVHTFYLVDEEEEARTQITSVEARMRAYSHMSSMSEEEVKDFLILYGKDATSVSSVQAKAKLGEYIETNPKKFIGLFEDNNKSYKVKIGKMVAKKTLRREGSAYYFGPDGDAVFLGGTLELAIDYLKDNKNQELWVNLLKLLEDKGE